MFHGFQQYLRNAKDINLRALWFSLREVKDVDLEQLLIKGEQFKRNQYSLQRLPLDFPMLRFEGLEKEWVIIDLVHEDFWAALFHLLCTRKEWAWRAYNALAVVLREPESENPLLALREEDKPSVPNAEPSLSREGICKWEVNQVDFIELFYALIESKAIVAKNKEKGASALARFLGISLTRRYYDVVAEIRSRENQTAFLETIQAAFKKAIDREIGLKK